MKREMGRGLRLDQLRVMARLGRWPYSVNCWPYGERWVLGVCPRGDRGRPHYYLIAEKSGEPRALTAETALRIAEELTHEGVYFRRESFESVTQARPWHVAGES